MREPQIYRRTINGFVPANEPAERFAKRSKIGQLVKLEGSHPRNLKHLKKYFALLRTAFPHTEYDHLEQFRHVLTCRMGYCDFVPDGKGGLQAVPYSISFDSMKDEVFQEFYDNAIDAILKHFLPGTDRADLDEAVMEIVRFAG
jgi:hypothetical protein